MLAAAALGCQVWARRTLLSSSRPRCALQQAPLEEWSRETLSHPPSKRACHRPPLAVLPWAMTPGPLPIWGCGAAAMCHPPCGGILGLVTATVITWLPALLSNCPVGGHEYQDIVQRSQ